MDVFTLLKYKIYLLGMIMVCIFSLPIFQPLVLHWVFWILYLCKISNMPLKLNPAHLDVAGGIGFLALPPSPYLLTLKI